MEKWKRELLTENLRKFLPYVLVPLEDGKWIILNRHYLPLGQTDQTIERAANFSDYPDRFKFEFEPCLHIEDAKAISCERYSQLSQAIYLAQENFGFGMHIGKEYRRRLSKLERVVPEHVRRIILTNQDIALFLEMLGKKL